MGKENCKANCREEKQQWIGARTGEGWGWERVGGDQWVACSHKILHSGYMQHSLIEEETLLLCHWIHATERSGEQSRISWALLPDYQTLSSCVGCSHVPPTSPQSQLTAVWVVVMCPHHPLNFNKQLPQGSPQISLSAIGSFLINWIIPCKPYIKSVEPL